MTLNKKELVRLGSEIKGAANKSSVAMLRKSRNLNLGFRNLTVDIYDGKNTKRIIDNVSGDIRAGRLTAIMGPSGAGKSSFLHVIGGRLRQLGESQKAVNIRGAVLINGERRSMHSYRRVIGFVPQDDVLHNNLSPKEAFRLISGLRLPDTYTYKQRKELVNNVLALLDLEKVRHDRIGDAEQRGLSGGQRKRVNIGIELVADPWMLFLDEPTR
jgi:ABC-type multidrug transport system ATPase subunit